MKKFFDYNRELDPFLLPTNDGKQGVECPFYYEIYTTGKKIRVKLENSETFFLDELRPDEIQKINSYKSKRSSLFQTILKELREYEFPRKHDIEGEIKADDVAEMMVTKLVKELYRIVEDFTYTYHPESVDTLTEDEEEKEELTEEEKEEIDKLIEQMEQDPIFAIWKAYEQEGLTGENKNKILMFLQTLNGGAVQIRGESSAGKTFLANITRLFFPKNYITKIGAMTQKALLRKDWEEVRRKAGTKRIVLYIQEMLNSNTPESDQILRLLCNEDDEGIMFEATIKDDTSPYGFKTETIHIKDVGLITTTTNLTMDHEQATRTWIITIDDSEEQTKKIKKAFRRFLMRIPRTKEEELYFKAFKKWVKKMLKTHEYIDVHPFAELFDSPNITRTRRDEKKFFSLAGVLAKLYMKDRMTYEYRGQKYVIVEPADMFMAERLVKEIFKQTITEIDQRLEKVFLQIKEIINRQGFVTQIDVAQLIGRTKKTAKYKYINPLCECGFLIEDEHPEDKRKVIYKLGKAANIDFNVERTEEKYYELFQEWLKEIEQRAPEIKKQLEEKYPEIVEKNQFLIRLSENVKNAYSGKIVEILEGYWKPLFSQKINDNKTYNNKIEKKEDIGKNDNEKFIYKPVSSEATFLEKVLNAIKKYEEFRVCDITADLDADPYDVLECINELCKRGILYEPRTGWFRRVQ